MQQVVAMLLQSVAPVAGPEPTDAARLRATLPCAADANEIVVCARRGDEFRLGPLPLRGDASDLPRARVGVAGGTLSAETEQGSLGGTPTNRVLIRWRLRF